MKACCVLANDSDRPGCPNDLYIILEIVTVLYSVVGSQTSRSRRNMKSAGVSFVGSSFLLFFICAVVPTTSRAQTSSTGRLEFAYAVDQNTNAVLGYKVGTTGALATPSFHAGVAPNSIAIDPSGRFVYVVNLLSDNVSGYAISADGTLKPVPGSPF